MRRRRPASKNVWLVGPVIAGLSVQVYLTANIIRTLIEAKVLVERWRQHYNTIRPHSALRYRLPAPEPRRPLAGLPP